MQKYWQEKWILGKQQYERRATYCQLLFQGLVCINHKSFSVSKSEMATICDRNCPEG